LCVCCEGRDCAGIEDSEDLNLRKFIKINFNLNQDFLIILNEYYKKHFIKIIFNLNKILSYLKTLKKIIKIKKFKGIIKN